MINEQNKTQNIKKSFFENNNQGNWGMYIMI